MIAKPLHIPPGSSPAAIIRILRAHYVRTGRDTPVEEAFDVLLQRDDNGQFLPKPMRFGSETEQEAHGLIVIGESGTGKSTTIGNILRNHPAFAGLQRADGTGPILKVDVPSPATLKSLGRKILEVSGYDQLPKSQTEAQIWDAVRHRLKRCGICVLWLDEAQDVIRTGAESEIMNICNTLKTLCKGEHAVVVVLSGVDVLAKLPRFDPQIDSRFNKVWLPRIGSSSDVKGIERLIAAYCKAAGLEAPRQPDLVPRLFHSTGYRLGKSIARVVDAMELAINARDTALSIHHFARAFAIKEGCDASRNVFVAEKWRAINLSEEDGDEEQQWPPKSRKSRKSRSRE